MHHRQYPLDVFKKNYKTLIKGSDEAVTQHPDLVFYAVGATCNDSGPPFNHFPNSNWIKCIPLDF
jgi:hypothetical protein